MRCHRTTLSPFSPLLTCFFGLALLAGGATGQCIPFSVDGPTAGAQLGLQNSIVIVGDVNGDGRDDWACGQSTHSLPFFRAGIVRLYSGRDHSLLWESTGTAQRIYLGTSLDRIDDLDGDGVPDVIAGGYGFVYALSGATGAILYSVVGDQADDELGFAVAGLSDIDGDDIADFAASAPAWNTNDGYLRFYSGVSGTVILTQFQSAGTARRYGHSLANVGDMNADGTDDLAVGAPLHDGASISDVGFVRVISGANLNGSSLQFVFGDASGDQLGNAVSGLGDVNGDGVPDFAAGALFATPDSNGMVRVYSGAASGGTIRTITAPLPYDGIGSSIANGGDFDLDGTPDMLVGIPKHNPIAGPTFDEGAAWVVSGADGSVIQELVGRFHSEEFGRGLAGGSDLNGDGRPEIIVGAPRRSYGGVSRQLVGSVSVFSVGDEYPGTCNGDFILQTGINAVADSRSIKSAVAGDLLSVRVGSPNGSRDGNLLLLAAQAFATGSLNLGTPGLAGVHLNFAAVPQPAFLVGEVVGPTGPAIILPGGNVYGFALPGQPGVSIILQGVALTGGPEIYVATAAHEIQLN